MDENNIRTYLDEEIEDEIKELSGLELGSESYKAAVDGVAKLMDRKIEMEKLEFEHAEQVKTREYEEATKRMQSYEDRKDRIIKDTITVAGFVIPSVITIWGTIKSLKFEEEGTVTTIMGRGFIQKLLPRK